MLYSLFVVLKSTFSSIFYIYNYNKAQNICTKSQKAFWLCALTISPLLIA